MEYRSDIRQSQIDKLTKKVSENNYHRYLKSINFSKIRGFSKQKVTFDFPVTAIIGPNGGGKTTVLGAAGCAYKIVRPRRYFAKSGSLDDDMKNWSMEYELVDKDINPKENFRRTASFKKEKWSRGSVNRDVLEFGVNRTVPPSEKNEYVKFAKPSLKIKGSPTVLPATVAIAVTRILGKEVSEYAQLSVDASGRMRLLTGKTGDGTSFSEFHFGAGESSVIKMILQIEDASESCLILIEEIENGLHPLATVRMVEYLVEVAERKKAQVVFTTHSNDALLPLPSHAIWAAVENELFPGKLDIKSLRAITHNIENRLVIFCEDEFAKKWIASIIRHLPSIDPAIVEVHAMEGDGSAVKYNKHHNSDPSIKTRSICILDGDSKQNENSAEGIYRLPGGMPETTVFEQVFEMRAEVSAKLTLALCNSIEQQNTVMELCQKTFQGVTDKHLLYTKIGERLGFLSQETVANAFTSQWCQLYPAEVLKLEAIILGHMPK